MSFPDNRFEAIRAKAMEIGFDACGISRATNLPQQETLLKQWIAEGKHATLGYLERKMDLRLDPRLVLEGAKTVIVVLESYYTEAEASPLAPPLGRYAWLRDYHVRMKEKLAVLDRFIAGQSPLLEYKSRVFVDTAPVMEKVWAMKAGLGWIGKNTLFVHPHLGSHVNIGIILCNDPLGSDAQMHQLNADLKIPDNGCGSCEACKKACPGKALEQTGALEVAKCYSYLSTQPGTNQNCSTLIGCDVCQDVCPWNKKTKRKPHPAESPWNTLYRWSYDEWLQMDQSRFDTECKETSFYKMGLPFLQARVEMLKNTIFGAENET